MIERIPLIEEQLEKDAILRRIDREYHAQNEREVVNFDATAFIDDREIEIPMEEQVVVSCAVDAAMQDVGLNERERRITRLRYEWELSEVQVAAIVGVTQSMVRRATAKARSTRWMAKRVFDGYSKTPKLL